MEQTPDEARFERIEASHEFITGLVAGIAITQQKLGEAQLRTEYALTGAVEYMDREHKRLLTAQVIMSDEMRKLAEAQAKTEGHIDALAVKSAETQGKLDALIHMWDDWIKERGGKNGKPTPEPPPSAQL